MAALSSSDSADQEGEGQTLEMCISESVYLEILTSACTSREDTQGIISKKEWSEPQSPFGVRKRRGS